MPKVTKRSKIALLPKTLMTVWDGTGARAARVDRAQLPRGWLALYQGLASAGDPCSSARWQMLPGHCVLAQLTQERGEAGGRSPSAGENFHCWRCVVLDSAKKARPLAKNTKGIYLKNAGNVQRTGGREQGILRGHGREDESWDGKRAGGGQ